MTSKGIESDWEFPIRRNSPLGTITYSFTRAICMPRPQQQQEKCTIIKLQSLERCSFLSFVRGAPERAVRNPGVLWAVRHGSMSSHTTTNNNNNKKLSPQRPYTQSAYVRTHYISGSRSSQSKHGTKESTFTGRKEKKIRWTQDLSLSLYINNACDLISIHQ